MLRADVVSAGESETVLSLAFCVTFFDRDCRELEKPVSHYVERGILLIVDHVMTKFLESHCIWFRQPSNSFTGGAWTGLGHPADTASLGVNN